MERRDMSVQTPVALVPLMTRGCFKATAPTSSGWGWR